MIVNKPFAKKSLLDVVYIKVLSQFFLIKPFTMDLYLLISFIPVSANCFTKKYKCFQNHSDNFSYF